MLTWIKQLVAAPVFEDEEQTRAASALNTALWPYLAIAVAYGIVAFALPNPEAALPLVGSLILLGLGARLLMQRGHVQAAGLLLTCVAWVFITILTVLTEGVNGPVFFGYIVVTLIAGLLLSGRAGFLFAALSMVAGLGMLWAENSGLMPSPIALDSPVSKWAALCGYVLIAGALLNISANSLKKALELTRRSERALIESNRELLISRSALEIRTRGLLAATEISRVTTSLLDPDELPHQAVNLIQGRFNLYYVGLFLLDETGRFAVLQAGTGKAGQQMLAQEHKLEVGSASMIGQCVSKAKALIASDGSAEVARSENPLLPETRAELALPLRSRGQVIGAMTVQRARENAFDQADVAVMQTVADQVAVAIDNARLFTATQAALVEAQAIHQRYLSQAWTDYLRTSQITGYETPLEGAAPLGDRVLPEIQQAVEQQSATALTHADGRRPEGDDGNKNDVTHSALVVPITLRGGEVIGALGIHDDEGVREWSDDEIALVEAVTQRMSMAAENLRLLDETQHRESRERLTREITDEMRRATDLDTLIQTTARGMAKALGTSSTFVQLSAPPESGENKDRNNKNDVGQE